MIKSVLICTDGSTHAEDAASYGIDLAIRLRARVAALHVLDSRMIEGPMMADIVGSLGATPYGGQTAQFRELMLRKGEAVLAAFESSCESRGIPCETRLKTGHPATVIVEEQVRAELIVMGQQGEHADWSGDMTGSTVERVARRALIPCLVVPRGAAPIRRIVAAYDGSGHSSRGLHEAIELSITLAVPLVIMTVNESADPAHARTISEDGIRLARAHDCAAANLVVEGSPADMILSQAEDLECDLIVVGAFGSSRIHELILGSTTSNLLARSKKPLLLVR